MSWNLLASLGVGMLLAVSPPSALSPADPKALVSVGPIERDAVDGRPGTARFTVEVLEEGRRTPQRFVVSAPAKMIGLEETPKTYLVGSRLVVHTEAVIAIFDRAENRQVLDVVASPGVAATQDGRRLAYEVLQLPFTSPEASGSVVVVVDVGTLDRQPVFPEQSAISPKQRGRFSVWEEDPAKRHYADHLAFSPDGSRLAFTCSHGLGGDLLSRQVYLVLVDLARRLGQASFLHVPFDWSKHIRAGVDLNGQEPFFAAESLIWSSEETLVIKRSPAAWWLEPEIILPVKGLVAAASSAAPEGSRP